MRLGMRLFSSAAPVPRIIDKDVARRILAAKRAQREPSTEKKADSPYDALDKISDGSIGRIYSSIMTAEQSSAQLHREHSPINYLASKIKVVSLKELEELLFPLPHPLHRQNYDTQVKKIGTRKSDERQGHKLSLAKDKDLVMANCVPESGALKVLPKIKASAPSEIDVCQIIRALVNR